jgi:hypothetical protein
MPVGSAGVANFANTTQGAALDVYAPGGLGGSGEVVLYSNAALALNFANTPAIPSNLTWARNIAASVIDQEGLNKTAKANEARFQNARRVENLLTYSEDFSNAAWTKRTATVASGYTDPNGGTNAWLLTPGAGSTDAALLENYVFVTGNKYVFSIWLKSNTGNNVTTNISFNSTDFSAGEKTATITVTTSWKRFSITGTAITFQSAPISVGGFSSLSDGENILIYAPQLEDVTGQANQNPSEYVSTNVLSYPYQGAGVDGVQYFATTNPNYVVNNVVSVGTSTALPARRVENLLTYSEDFSNAAWVKTTQGVGSIPSVSVNYSLAPNGTMTADRIQMALNGGNTTGTRSWMVTQPLYTLTVSLFSIWLKTTDGSTKALYITNSSAGSLITVTGDWKRFSTNALVSSGIAMRIGLIGGLNTDDSADILYWGAQLEDVTGQANTNPSEYVSINALSAPWQGGGKDGVKYFTTTNGNTVASNIVTEAVGVPLTPGITLLAEEARTNLCLYSTVLNAPAYYVTNPTLTVGQLAPNGSNTATLMTGTGTSTSQRFYQAITSTASVVYTFSFYVAAGTERYIVLAMTNTGVVYTIVDTTNWTIVNTLKSSGSGVFVASTISDPLKYGFRRITLTGSIGEANALIRVTFTNDVNTYQPTYATSGTAIVWQLQAEAGYTASSPIITGAAAVTRTADVPSFLGTQSVTNLCLQSEDITTTWGLAGGGRNANQYIAPNGTLTMDQLVGDGLNTNQQLYQAIAINAGLSTLSVFVKYDTNQWLNIKLSDGITPSVASFDLLNGVVGSVSNNVTSKITRIGGVYRCELTCTPVTTASGQIAIAQQNADTAIMTVHTTAITQKTGVWGAQLEAAASAGAYVPTTTAAVTAYTAPPTWYNAQQGTFVIKASGKAFRNPSPFGTFNLTLPTSGTYVLVYNNTVKDGSTYLYTLSGGLTPTEYTGISVPTTILMLSGGLENISNWTYYAAALPANTIIGLLS